jgi:hypothetical protein
VRNDSVGDDKLMLEAALLLYLFQLGDATAPHAPGDERRMEMRKSTQAFWSGEQGRSVSADAVTQEASCEECDFTKRFNGLVHALVDFASSYNAGVVNAKKAKAVRKALRELEKSDWFQRAKGD